MSHTITRYHDISCGHRVVGHEGKCQHIHGHNYRVHFTCVADKLDEVGRIVDFSVMKDRLCMWLETHWDHKFLAWEDDVLMRTIDNATRGYPSICEANEMFKESIVWVSFNPTAENMAEYLVEVVGPTQLVGTGVTLISCRVEETRKCSAEYHKD